MHTQHKLSWVPLISLAACAGLATTPAFAGEPHALMRRVQVSDEQYISSSADALSQVDPPAENAQSVYLIKLLKRSSQFRVRAQAAISLGTMERSFEARAALTAALQDPHPAVRAAAATSLGRLGDASHVIALRMLAGDAEAPVRNAARASIGRIELEIEVVLTAAARSATTVANRL